MTNALRILLKKEIKQCVLVLCAEAMIIFIKPSMVVFVDIKRLFWIPLYNNSC